MTTSNQIEGLFKGIVKTVIVDEDWTFFKKQDHLDRYTWNYKQKQGKQVAVFVNKKKLFSLITAISKSYPEKIDKETVSMQIRGYIIDFIEENRNADDQNAIHETVTALIGTIEESIKTYRVLIPIVGLNLQAPEFPIGSGVLFNTKNENNDFQRLLKVKEDRFKRPLSKFEKEKLDHSEACFKTSIVAQSKQAIATAEKHADIAMDILRLYKGVSMFDIFLQPQRRILGVLGHIPVRGSTAIFWAEGEDEIANSNIGSSETLTSEPFDVNHTWIDKMMSVGLTRINEHVTDVLNGQGGNLSQRLFRSLVWFSKGTEARNIADSFLSYAISVESLLSEGNTSQDSFAKQIAALVTQGDVVQIYPYDGFVATDFSKRLNNSKSKPESIKIIQLELQRAFKLRNDIAHGRQIGADIALNRLVTFETLVRNAILAIIVSPWNTLSEFKIWFESLGI